MRFFSLLLRPFARAGVLLPLLSLLAACSFGGGASASGAGNSGPVARKTPAQPLGQITEFAVPTKSSSALLYLPIAIARGADNNLWFTEGVMSLDQSQADQSLLGRITPDGKVTTFPLLTRNTLLTGITRGPDGNLWFVEGEDVNTGTVSSYAGKVGYITPGGKINEFLLANPNSDPWMITAGPDGNLWFTDSSISQIGRMSPHGQLTEFPLPTGDNNPRGITAGPDGNLWFTESSQHGGQIGRITPTGTVTFFPLPGGMSDAPALITAGPDGNLWFTTTHWDGPNIASEIGRITLTGQVTTFTIPNAQGYSQGGGGYLFGIPFGPLAIASGPDGNLWFSGIFPKGMIGRITPGGVIDEFSLPKRTGAAATGVSYGIASGPDGNLWFTDANSNQIGRIGTGK